MKLAIIHDSLLLKGGAERVFLNIAEEFSEADIYTLAYNPLTTCPEFKKFHIHTTWANRLIRSHKIFKILFPIATCAMERLDLRKYDIVLSSSATVAKYIGKFNGIHICYCYFPTRAIWQPERYFSDSGPKYWLGNILASLLRRRDVKASRRVNRFVAISEVSRKAIKKIYGRESDVIFSPINYERFVKGLSEQKADHYLIVSRLEPWKCIDYAIEAFNQLGLPLKVVGAGSARSSLKAMANSNIEFMGELDDNQLVREYGKSKAVIFTPELEYGLIPLEANAAGTPVIALGKGGVRETMIPANEPNAKSQCATAVFFYEQTPASLMEAVKNFEQFEFNRESISEHAKKFSVPAFKSSLRNYVEDVIGDKRLS